MPDGIFSVTDHAEIGSELVLIIYTYDVLDELIKSLACRGQLNNRIINTV